MWRNFTWRKTPRPTVICTVVSPLSSNTQVKARQCVKDFQKSQTVATRGRCYQGRDLHARTALRRIDGESQRQETNRHGTKSYPFKLFTQTHIRAELGSSVSRSVLAGFVRR